MMNQTFHTTAADNNNNSSTTIDESVLGQPYKGPVKMIWQNGTLVQVPDYELLNDPVAASIASSNNKKIPEEYVYQKTLKDILTEEDKTRFKNLRTDEEKYDFVRNLIGGTIDSSGSSSSDQIHHLWNSEIAAYVHGDKRSLEDVLQDLLDRKKVYMDLDGNLFLMSYALQEHMIRFPCGYCSAVLFSDREKRLHTWSHQQRARS